MVKKPRMWRRLKEHREAYQCQEKIIGVGRGRVAGWMKKEACERNYCKQECNIVDQTFFFFKSLTV